MPKLWALFTIFLAVLITVKVFHIASNTASTWSQFDSFDTPLISGFTYSRSCVELMVEVLDMQRRIKLVGDYILSNQQGDLPRECILIVGVPGSMSEVVGESLGSAGSRVLYLPNILNSLAYYMKYEPTIGFPMATVLIEDVFKCNFEEKVLLVNHLMRKDTRHRSPSFVDAPTCGAKEHDTETLTQCQKAFSDWLTRKCLASDLIVGQTVQFKSISFLDVFMTETKSRLFRLHVLHTVRDPRAIAHDLSERAADQWTADQLKTVSYRICMNMMLNIKTANSNPGWLKGRYERVRIENLLIDQQTYPWDGLLKKVSDYHSGPVSYGIGRKNRTQFRKEMNSWRLEMSLTDIHIVQSNCAKIMDALGYQNYINIKV